MNKMKTRSKILFPTAFGFLIATFSIIFPWTHYTENPIENLPAHAPILENLPSWNQVLADPEWERSSISAAERGQALGFGVDVGSRGNAVKITV
jgi:hypothetical protein